MAGCPTFRNIGTGSVVSKDAVNVFHTMKYEEAAVKPPYPPRPAPKLAVGRRAPPSTEDNRVVDIDAMR